jgi:hypothetical protein
LSGPRILLFVLVGVIALVWMALADDPTQDRERGMQESALALAAVEAELEAMEPAYRLLSRDKLRLDLKTEHDEVRSRLALLRARRIKLSDDEQLERHAVLPAFREIVSESDEVLAFARALGRRVEARHAFIIESSPLLRDARSLRDQLLGIEVGDPELARRVDESAGWFAELEGHALRADTMLQQNPEQGGMMADATLKGLRSYLEEAAALRDSIVTGG